MRVTEALSFLTVMLLILLIGCGDGSDKPSSGVPEVATAGKALSEEPEGIPHAVIETEKGEIVVRLLPEIAPETAQRFIELANVGFYSRTSFHRVMKDRMIQGGDPLSRDADPFNDGQGTSGTYLPQEFGEHPFERGTVAMGREAGSDNGGSCQFFIVLQRTPEWDGEYNAFGTVVEGIEVAEEISQVRLTQEEHPALKFRPAGKQLIQGVRIEYRDQ